MIGRDEIEAQSKPTDERRARLSLRGRTLTGRSHDYKCNGTSTLFVAFEVGHREGDDRLQKSPAARRVSRLHEPHRCRDTALHIALDNLNAHKPRMTARSSDLKARFHFTPTRLVAQPSGDLVLDP
jgi:hypothetical protein